MLSAKRSSQSGSFAPHHLHAAQLAALDQYARYTLDLIDYYHGGWGWVAMDTVPIPGTTAAPTNIPPLFSDITDRTINTNSTTGPIAFTVTDDQTPAGALILTARSGNTNLVPDSSIVLGGSGSNRTVTVTPPPTAVGYRLIGVRDRRLADDRETFLLTIQNVRPPTSLVPRGVTWKYFDPDIDPGTSWRSNSFSDATWTAGPRGRLWRRRGSHPGPQQSPALVDLYFRRTFNRSNAFRLLRPGPPLSAGRRHRGLSQRRGDLAGNMPAGTIGYQTFASTNVSGTDETRWFSATLLRRPPFRARTSLPPRCTNRTPIAATWDSTWSFPALWEHAAGHFGHRRPLRSAGEQQPSAWPSSMHRPRRRAEPMALSSDPALVPLPASCWGVAASSPVTVTPVAGKRARHSS